MIDNSRETKEHLWLPAVAIETPQRQAVPWRSADVYGVEDICTVSEETGSTEDGFPNMAANIISGGYEI